VDGGEAWVLRARACLRLNARRTHRSSAPFLLPLGLFCHIGGRDDEALVASRAPFLLPLWSRRCCTCFVLLWPDNLALASRTKLVLLFFYPIRPRASSMVDVVCGLSASPRTRFQTQIGSFVFFNPIRPRASSIVDVGCGLGAGPRTRFRNQRLREPLGSTAISSETNGTPHPLNPRTSP
jgi:hypothetical protein